MDRLNQIDETEEQKLTEDLLKKQEKVQALQKEIQAKNKRIKHIEASKTYKLATVIRNIKNVINKLLFREKIIEQKKYIATLENKLKEAEKELYEAKVLIHELKLKDTEIHQHDIRHYIRQMKDDGELLAFLDRFIHEKKKRQQNYKEALTYTARLYMDAGTSYKNQLYSKILAGLAIEEIPEFMIRSGLSHKPIPLVQVASFRANLNIRIRKQQLHGALPEWYFDDKRNSYHFVEKLGIDIPNVDEAHYTVNTLPKRKGIVVKPVDAAGARGVYLIHDFDDIFDVKNSITISSWENLKLSMEKDLETGAVDRDEWMIEELIYENRREKVPARDVKFYCFYGKVGIILEIVREPEVRHCWWNAERKRVTTGKYDESLFNGLGVTEEEVKMAEQISKKIPAPFIRIDFLRGEDGLIFGEFTPKPGNYDEFDDETDRILGDYFLKAETKLIDDLIQGKRFVEYEQFIDDIKQLTV